MKKKVWDHAPETTFSGAVKILLKMKLTLCIILFSFLGAIASESYSQVAKISLDLRNAKVRDVLDVIENQSEFYFLYSEKLIDVDRKVDVELKESTIEKILSKIFEDTNVNYIVKGRQIILTTSETNWASSVSQQPKSVSGKVTDSSGQPLPGVTVVVKGTNQGTITSANGTYSIQNLSPSATLVFSFIGMKSQEVKVENKTALDVQMQEDAIGLEEVVAIGYGVQKKVNLSGSVTVVKVGELESISTPSIVQSIMGRSPGVFIKNKKGQPGEDGVDFNIRGFGTPLIIVDGSPVNSSYFQQLNPQDIESFNVLKDASAAAVYGARAGNGVILVTTKRGTVSAPEFSYDGNFGWQFFTKYPRLVDSGQYTAMHNLGRVYFEGLAPMYTDEEVQKYRDGTDPNYSSTDWWDFVVRDFAPQQQHGVTVRGGTETVKYFASIGYFDQKGMHVSDDTDNKRLSLRSNIDVKLTKKINIGVDISLTNQKYIGSSMQFERPAAGGSQIMGRLLAMPPFATYKELPDPSYIPAILNGSQGNPYDLGFIDNVGFKKFDKLYGFAKLNFEYKLPYNIVFKAVFDMNRTYNRERLRVLQMNQYDYDEANNKYILRRTDNTFNSLEETNSILNNFNQQYFLTWDKSFGKHQVGTTFVYESLRDDFDYLQAYRRDFQFPIDYLFAGPDANKSNDGYATEGGRKAFIGRINYNYMGKYILETSARYDGSPKFPSATRWGFFPSGSIAWRISEEPFIKDNLPVISNMKIRASHGRLGYDAAGQFQYLATFSIKSQYIYDSTLQPGIRADALPNTSITWEKMSTSNIGIDFNLWDGRLLEGSLEYFYRKRSDVLGTRIAAIPEVVGASLPKENIEEYDDRGWELTLRHSRKLNDFDYSIGLNVSTTRSKTVYTDQAEFASMEAYRRGNKVGEWTDRVWAYPTDGLFQSQEEIDNWADIDGLGNRTIAPGDIKYVDYNNDGRITEEDKILAGRGTMPKLIFGSDISVSWKGFNIMMLWQGAGLYNYNLAGGDRRFMMPFYGTPTTYEYENMYTPENPWIPTNTTNAKWPRYGTDPANRNHSNFRRDADFWLTDGSYIRLKNIEIGYTLPNSITKRWGIENLKIFVGGYNVLTFTKDNYDFVDPEIDTNPAYGFGDYYPVTGTYNVGVQLNFAK